jgi:hypothetical protein
MVAVEWMCAIPAMERVKLGARYEMRLADERITDNLGSTPVAP